MTPAPEQGWTDIFYTSQDGLRLYARHYRAENSRGRPAVCLAGLTRNASDFHALAMFLSRHPTHPRDVYCPDYRGRGRSARDPDWRNYTVFIELIDVLDLMTREGLHDACIFGTSRGGLLAMVMGAMRPGMMGAVVLNDIGPRLEPEGLARIAGYVGQGRVPDSWNDAVAAIRRANEPCFSALNDEDWVTLAHQWFDEKDGRPVSSYDPALARSLTQFGSGATPPSFWPQFASLARLPAMVLRGENSDLLSPETVDEMTARHPGLVAHTVPDQGHAPLLRDAPTLDRIAEFLARTDARSE